MKTHLSKNINKPGAVNKVGFLLPLVALSLLTGIWTGWIRIGWNFPLTQNMGDHGSLMVGGFIGTLICIERTVTFNNKIVLLIPFVNSLSIVFFLLKMPDIAYWLLLAGSIGLVVIYFTLYTRFNELEQMIMTAGAMCYLIGCALLIKTSFYPVAAMWWIAFLYLTIVGERIELSRYLNISSRNKYFLTVLLGLYIVGILMSFHSSGGIVIAVSFFGSAIWLFKFDMARKSLIREGQFFYSGIVLLTGYVWLIISALFFAYGSFAGLLYDPALHSFFLGFVFSMIFAHAPIILPGVLKLQINLFSKSLYIWFFMLQISLLSRIAGSLLVIPDIKVWAGLFNGITILGFLLNMLYLVISRRKQIQV